VNIVDRRLQATRLELLDRYGDWAKATLDDRIG